MMQIPEDELRSMYIDDKMTQMEIGELYGITHHHVSLLMKKYGIKSRENSESKLGRPRQGNSPKPSKEDLAEMYWGRGMSTYEIGELCGVSYSVVYNWIRDYGIETRTISEAMMNGDFTGEKNSNWKGGISKQPYCYKFNNAFREAVRERDGYTCQLCGFEQNGRKLDVHHIHYKKSDCYPDVITLCRSCNIRVNGDRDYWEEHFENQIIERGLMYWSLS